jgi:hypothetical protein
MNFLLIVILMQKVQQKGLASANCGFDRCIIEDLPFIEKIFSVIRKNARFSGLPQINVRF